MDFTLSLADAWAGFERFLDPLLRNLDPSLFQNVILGILAIFIPFAIVFLTDVLDSKKSRSAFEKMVLEEEVLGTKNVFWFSVIGIAFLAFFAGKDISVLAKSTAIIFSIIILFLLSKPLWKILRFSEGHGLEFEISFLESLTFSRMFRFRNKSKAKKMIRAWNSLWSEEAINDEGEFTKIFIKHIDDAMENKRYELAVSLAQAYQKNLDKRDRFLIGDKMLPKIFQWHEKCWRAEQVLRSKEREGRPQEEFLTKACTTFRKWVSGLLRQRHTEEDLLWDFDPFQRELFPGVIKNSLQYHSGCHLFFEHFKKYIDEAETKLETIKDEDRHNRWWNYITNLFRVFCDTLFENVNSVCNQPEFWRHNFPEAWKVTMENSQERAPRIILGEFLWWAPRWAFKGTDYSRELSEVATGFFPNAHSRLFSAFLILLFSPKIKDAIQREPSFSIRGQGFTWQGKKTEEEIQQILLQQEQLQHDATIDVIFEYFGQSWGPLRPCTHDLSREEYEGWDRYSETQKKRIIDKVRKVKLQKTLASLDSEEIRDLCQKSERCELQRNNFVELIESLLERISQRVYPTT